MRTTNYTYKNSAGDYAPAVLTINGRKVINPTEQMYAEAGYFPCTPQTYTPSQADIRQQQIDQLKAQLAESDYKAIKFAEGWISEDDYAPIKQQRQLWREEINRLEAEQNE